MGLYEGVKAADPNALAIVDTAGWLHYGFIERLVKEDRALAFDILAWHWYSEMGEMTNVQGKRNLIEFFKRYDCPCGLPRSTVAMVAKEARNWKRPTICVMLLRGWEPTQASQEFSFTNFWTNPISATTENRTMV
jgi:hypothetical protein